MERKSKRRLVMGEKKWAEYQKTRQVKKVVQHRRRLKWRLVEYAGGKCRKCNYDKKIPGAFAFHHKNKDKEFGIAGNYGKSIATLKKEIDKCDLLCVRCHAELHYEIEQDKMKGSNAR